MFTRSELATLADHPKEGFGVYTELTDGLASTEDYPSRGRFPDRATYTSNPYILRD